MAVCADGHESQSTDYCDVCGSALIGAPDPTALRLCPNCGVPTSGRFCEGCGHDSALPPPTVRPDDRPDRADRNRADVPDRTRTDSAGASWTGARPESADPSRPDHSDPAWAGARPDQPEPRRAGTDPSRSSERPDSRTGSDPAVSRVVWVARVFADREFYTRVQARKGPDAERVAFPDFYPERRIILRGNQFLIGKRSASQGIVPEIDLGIAPADIGVSRAHAMIQVDPGGALTVTDLGSTNGTSLDGAETPIPPQHAIALREGSRIHVGGWTTIAITTER